MNMDNNNFSRAGMDGFMEHTTLSSNPPSFQPVSKERRDSEKVTVQDFETLRKQSLLPNIIRCVRSKVSVPAKVVAGMLTIALAAGGYVGYQLERFYHINDDYNAEVALAATDSLKKVIDDNKFTDEIGDSYWYDSVKIGETYRDMIQGGDTDSFSVAYAIKSNLNKDFEKDDVSVIYDVTFGKTPDEYAHSLGFIGYEDPAFNRYLEKNITEQTAHLPEDEMTQMVNDYAQSNEQAELSKGVVKELGGEK